MPSETDCCTFQILDLETSHAPSVATAAGYLLCYHIARSQVALKGNRHRVQRTDGISELRTSAGFRFYFVITCLVGVTVDVGAAFEIAKVNQTFQPSGRFSEANSL
jgi:hypothetical protein